MRFNWNPDPVERVFAIVIAGAIMGAMAVFLWGPDKILGMPRENLGMLLFFGAFGAGLGLRVVMWFRKRNE